MTTIRDVFFIGVCTALIVFTGAAARPLTQSSEGRVARVAQEMIDSGDWVVPHLNGTVRLEKPPFSSWLVAGVTKLSGAERVAPIHAYVPPGVATVLLVILVYAWMRQAAGASRDGSWLGVFAALVLATAPGFFLQARSAEMDMLLALFVALALWGFWQNRLSGCAGALMIAYVSVALCIHIKAHVGLVIIVPSLLIWNFVERSRSALPLPSGTLRWHMLGLTLVCVLVIPFGVLFIRRSGLTWDAFSREGLSGRFGSDVPHVQPFYFYLYSIPGWFLPWVLLLVIGLWQTRDLPPDERSPLRRLCWIWLGWSVLLFSCIGSKLRHYAVPFFPPLAILIADTMLRWRTHFDSVRAKQAGIALTVLSGLLAAGMLAAPGAAAANSLLPVAQKASVWALAIAAAVVFMFAAIRACTCGSTAFLLWAGAVCAVAVFSRTIETKDSRTSPERFCTGADRLVPREAELYDFDVALPRREGKSKPVWRAQVLFYLGRKVNVTETAPADFAAQHGAYAILTEKRLKQLPADSYETLSHDDEFLGHKNDVFLIRMK